MFKVIFDISVHFSANVTNTLYRLLLVAAILLPRSYPSKSFYYVGTSNRISTSGTCKFAHDGPSYASRGSTAFRTHRWFSADGMPPRFAFGVLPFLIYETILCFLMLWKAIQNYRDGYSIFTVLCLDFTLYCLHKEEWGEFIIAREYTIPCAMGCRLLVNTMEWAEVSKSSHDTIATPITFYRIERLPAHQSEVKITTVTPSLESYRLQTAIGQYDVMVTDELFSLRRSACLIPSNRSEVALELYQKCDMLQILSETQTGQNGTRTFCVSNPTWVSHLDQYRLSVFASQSVTLHRKVTG
ncbi:hypothetical protein BU17DRAFT_71657 [Hysterangium stoloniferum]|nr:hypothetical protein BU17DRAFT_71657 [Hysterangium stoloniferum]